VFDTHETILAERESSIVDVRQRKRVAKFRERLEECVIYNSLDDSKDEKKESHKQWEDECIAEMYNNRNNVKPLANLIECAQPRRLYVLPNQAIASSTTTVTTIEHDNSSIESTNNAGSC